jgi:hypothetical protein
VKLDKPSITFFAEISQPRSRSQHAAPALDDDQVILEDSEDQYGGADALDDSDVPVPEVDVHQVELVAATGPSQTPSTENLMEDLIHIYIADEVGGLSSAAEAEDTLIESIDSRVTDISSASTGRPTRTRRSNVLYSGKEWMDSDAIVGP